MIKRILKAQGETEGTVVYAHANGTLHGGFVNMAAEVTHTDEAEDTLKISDEEGNYMEIPLKVVIHLFCELQDILHKEACEA